MFSPGHRQNKLGSWRKVSDVDDQLGDASSATRNFPADLSVGKRASRGTIWARRTTSSRRADDTDGVRARASPRTQSLRRATGVTRSPRPPQNRTWEIYELLACRPPPPRAGHLRPRVGDICGPNSCGWRTRVRPVDAWRHDQVLGAQRSWFARGRDHHFKPHSRRRVWDRGM